MCLAKSCEIEAHQHTHLPANRTLNPRVAKEGFELGRTPIRQADCYHSVFPLRALTRTYLELRLWIDSRAQPTCSILAC